MNKFWYQNIQRSKKFNQKEQQNKQDQGRKCSAWEDFLFEQFWSWSFGPGPGPGPLVLVLWFWSFGPAPMVLLLWSCSFGPGPLLLVLCSWSFAPGLFVLVLCSWSWSYELSTYQIWVFYIVRNWSKCSWWVLVVVVGGGLEQFKCSAQTQAEH